MTQQQMKIMQYISPLMIGFFAWNYAAGLALYWTVSSVFAIFQQYFVTGWGSLLVTPNLISRNSNNNAPAIKAIQATAQKRRNPWQKLTNLRRLNSRERPRW